MKRSITIYRTPTDEWWAKTLENLWVTVLEGGSNYWIESVDYHGFTKDEKQYSIKKGVDLFENFPVTLHDGEELHTTRTFDVMYQGINRLPDELKLVIANDGDWDADDADHILQLGLFGEVRYG